MLLLGHRHTVVLLVALWQFVKCYMLMQLLPAMLVVVFKALHV